MEPIPMAVWLYLTALPSVCLWCVSTEAPWGLFVFRFVSQPFLLLQIVSISIDTALLLYLLPVTGSVLVLHCSSHMLRGASVKQCLQLLQLLFQYLPMCHLTKLFQ